MMVVIRGDYLLRKIHDNHRCARQPATDTAASKGDTWCGRSGWIGHFYIVQNLGFSGQGISVHFVLSGNVLEK